MPHPDLESARGKLGRAREHIAGFQAIDAYLRDAEAEPFDFRLEDDVQPNRIVVVVAELVRPNPLRSYILGDALHNFRSALDHVAWQVTQHGTALPLKASQESKVQFPICSARKEFDRLVPQWLPGIQPVHETVIRSHQPYQRGNLAEGHPLAILSWLSNTDKHRYINPMLVASAQYQLRAVARPNSGCKVLGVTEGPDLRKPLQVGAKLAYIDVSDRAACHGHMEVQAEGTLHIALREGLWLNDAISWIDREVADVLSEIDRVL